MKILFIGGTGNISTSVTRLAIERGHELYLLNRGTRPVDIPGAHILRADINDRDAVARVLAGHEWDVVVNWIAFVEDEIERDIGLFAGSTDQYIFISSASVYQRPMRHPVVTESTPLANPFWEYSRNKIRCEDRLNRAFRDDSFPMTIVRPAHTYDTVIPLSVGGWQDYTIIDRMKRGLPVVVHGDGSSLWTLTHAEDFALGFVGLMGNVQAIGHPFHITSDELLTWDQIYQCTARAAGVEADIVHVPSDFLAALDPAFKGSLVGDKATSTIFDNTKIKTFVPDFRAVIPYSQGIRRTLAWFEADPGRMQVRDESNQALDRLLGAWVTATGQ